MKYKELIKDTWRAYKGTDSLGFGATIIKTDYFFLAKIDISVNDSIIVLCEKEFASLSSAKTWATKYIKNIANTIDIWIKE